MGRAASMFAVAGAPVPSWLLPARLRLPPLLALLPLLLLLSRCSREAPPSAALLHGGKRAPLGAAPAAV
jgi:hypothetical protein